VPILALPDFSRHSKPIAVAAAFVAFATPADAHVKWFAPYIVGAPPAPISNTLSDVWFWTAIVLVLVFFRGDAGP
jgi:hypothetical protein